MSVVYLGAFIIAVLAVCLFVALTGSGCRAAASDDAIIAAIDPWMLACAVGAPSGQLGVPMTFDFWLSRSRQNWMPKVQAKICASERQIEAALRAYVEENGGRDYREVFRAEAAKRGESAAPVLGSGESVTLTVRQPQAGGREDDN